MIGQTAEAKQRKKGNKKYREWNKDTFIEELESRHGLEDRKVAEEIIHWAEAGGLMLWWGKGLMDGSFYPMLKHNKKTYWTISAWTYGKLDIQFNMMKLKDPPFNDELKRMELLKKINEIEEISIPVDSYNRYPSISLSVFQKKVVLKKFLHVLDWYLEEIKNWE